MEALIKHLLGEVEDGTTAVADAPDIQMSLIVAGVTFGAFTGYWALPIVLVCQGCVAG